MDVSRFFKLFTLLLKLCYTGVLKKRGAVHNNRVSGRFSQKLKKYTQSPIIKNGLIRNDAEMLICQKSVELETFVGV